MSKGPNRLNRCMRVPIRVLSRARDLYVRGMTGWASSMHQGMAMPVSYPMTMGEVPKSYDLRSSINDDDLRELIRAVSRRRVPVVGSPLVVVPTSHSVVMGRIDEDEPCEFVDEGVVARRRRCAVGAGSRFGVPN